MTGLLTRGHDLAAEAIRRMVVGPTPHAVLVSGPAGVGKTTLALDLAAGLLCDAPDPADRPCRACRACRLVARGIHPDVHRLAPGGPGNVIRIGSRQSPEPGTIRRLVTDLALLPVEGGARVAILERADRMGEDAQSALLKTLEEPPAGVTIVLCADDEEALLPTVRSRSARIRLGPVAVRAVEDLLAEHGDADAPTAGRLARLAAGRPGLARALAAHPESVLARNELVRSLIDLLAAGPAARLAAARSLLDRAAEIDRGLSGPTGPGVPPEADDDTAGSGVRTGSAAGGRGRSRARPAAARARSGATATTDQGSAADEDPDDDAARGAATGTAADRRRAALVVVDVWRDLTRDLALVGLGEERRLRDPGLLDDLHLASGRLDRAAAAAFLNRLDDAGELIEANVRPDLALDVLLLAWPHRPAG